MPELIKPTITSTGRLVEPWGSFGSNLLTDLERMFETFPRAPFGSLLQPSLLGSPLLQALTTAETAGLVVPRLDVLESDKEITLSCELPGMDLKEVELTVDDGVLTLKGEKKFEKKEKSAAHVVERRYGAFRRSFALPDFVDEKKIDAKFDKGILTITLPKSTEGRKPARKIEIH